MALLSPIALVGLEGLDEMSHAVLWTMLANIGAYVAVSVLSKQSTVEQTRAALFVDASTHDRDTPGAWGARGSLLDLYALMQRFLGPENARQSLATYAMRRGLDWPREVDADLARRVIALLDMETQLRRAVTRGDEFRVYYQPIVALPTGELAGFEALVRMVRTDGTLVPPGEFIPLTEETGLIVSIGRWVLTEACRQMQDWQRRFPEHAAGKISVNLAGRQFAQRPA